MELLLLARHAEAEANVGGSVSGVAPGGGLSETGRNQARALGRSLGRYELDLCATSEFRRTQETADVALAGLDVPRIVVPELNEIGFGSFEAGPLTDYRRWAWETGPADDGPGGGESRAAAAVRFARALELLLARPEQTVLAITHALALRHILDASEGLVPRARMAPVPHAEAVPIDAAAIRRAADLLAQWSLAPAFREQESA